LLLVTFPAGHTSIQASMQRFILFDGSGLVMLILAGWVAPVVQTFRDCLKTCR